jgi:tetratricopeptide (TPR) repeat protein
MGRSYSSAAQIALQIPDPITLRKIYRAEATDYLLYRKDIRSVPYHLSKAGDYEIALNYYSDQGNYQEATRLANTLGLKREKYMLFERAMESYEKKGDMDNAYSCMKHLPISTRRVALERKQLRDFVMKEGYDKYIDRPHLEDFSYTPKKAGPDFDNAVARLKNMRMWHGLANHYFEYGYYEEALTNYLNILEIPSALRCVRLLKDKKREIAILRDAGLFNEVADIYNEQGKKLMSAFNRGLAVRINDQNGFVFQAAWTAIIGKQHFAMNRAENAVIALESEEKFHDAAYLAKIAGIRNKAVVNYNKAGMFEHAEQVKGMELPNIKSSGR